MANLLKDQLNGVVPTDISTSMMEEILHGSCILPLANVHQMKAPKETFNVWADKPGAYFVNEGAAIPVTTATMLHPTMEAKKLGVLLTVTKEKLNDSVIDVFAELQPQIVEAIYRKLDDEILNGTDGVFGKNVMGVITSAGATITKGTNSTIDLDVSDAMALVEAKDYEPNGFLAPISMKNALRKLRDGNGNQLMFNGVGGSEFYGLPIEFASNGALKDAQANVVVADWNKLLVGILQDMEFSVSTDATIVDGSETINLFQQDLIGLKVTFRVAALPIKEDAFAAVIQ